jgi:predicted nucleic acid-binding protein
LVRNDRCHKAAKAALESLKKERFEPLLTNFIVAECHALLLSRVGADFARSWLLGNVWPVERLSVEDEAKAAEIIRQFIDKTFSYTDATSFAIMERLGIRRAFAFDPHFQQYGFSTIGPTNL